MQNFSADVLTDFATRLLVAGGLGTDEAALVAKSLVGANLRGHDSHGVMRIPSYLESCRKGEVVAGATLTALRESPGIFVGDAHWGFGQPQAQRLTRKLIEMARHTGLAVGTLIQCSHVGRLGEYCEMAAEAHLVSMLMVNTHGHARRVAPPGGKAPRLGTNPLAIGAPAPGGPLILDFGTSATAEGKVRVKRIAGQCCPDGWLLDSEGRPTNDPATLYGNPPGTIRPMGGDQAYKGFGLGLMVEIFAGALSGGVCIREVPVNQNGNCVFMLLLDPGHLGGAEHFAKEVSGLCAFVRSCPTIDGATEILLPGDPERRVLAERSAEGIPLDNGNWGELVKLAARLSVAVPA
jgi:uncharacterized oxidoreductase